jgi:release factor glutamine methyltransferase
MRDDVQPQPVQWMVFLTEAERRFEEAGFNSPDIEARRIVERASGYEGSQFHQGLQELTTVRAVSHFEDMVRRRLDEEPLQYVCGIWGFRTLDLIVDKRVLIPRPETEIVAGIAIEELERHETRNEKLVADLGTGSGAIGLSIAAETRNAEVFLTDISSEALQVARANLTGLGTLRNRVSIRQGSWFDALLAEHRGKFSLIVSNPPYVSSAEIAELPSGVRDWEPERALVSGEKGTESLEIIIAEAGKWLCSNGSLVLEMAPHQTSEIANKMRQNGYTDVRTFPDLTGRERGVRGIWNS